MDIRNVGIPHRTTELRYSTTMSVIKMDVNWNKCQDCGIDYGILYCEGIGRYSCIRHVTNELFKRLSGVNKWDI